MTFYLHHCLFGIAVVISASARAGSRGCFVIATIDITNWHGFFHNPPMLQQRLLPWSVTVGCLKSARTRPHDNTMDQVGFAYPQAPNIEHSRPGTLVERSFESKDAPTRLRMSRCNHQNPGTPKDQAGSMSETEAGKGSSSPLLKTHTSRKLPMT